MPNPKGNFDSYDGLAKHTHNPNKLYAPTIAPSQSEVHAIQKTDLSSEPADPPGWEAMQRNANPINLQGNYKLYFDLSESSIDNHTLTRMHSINSWLGYNTNRSDNMFLGRASYNDQHSDAIEQGNKIYLDQRGFGKYSAGKGLNESLTSTEMIYKDGMGDYWLYAKTNAHAFPDEFLEKTPRTLFGPPGGAVIAPAAFALDDVMGGQLETRMDNQLDALQQELNLADTSLKSFQTKALELQLQLQPVISNLVKAIPNSADPQVQALHNLKTSLTNSSKKQVELEAVRQHFLNDLATNYVGVIATDLDDQPLQQQLINQLKADIPLAFNANWGAIQTGFDAGATTNALDQSLALHNLTDTIDPNTAIDINTMLTKPSITLGDRINVANNVPGALPSRLAPLPNMLDVLRQNHNHMAGQPTQAAAGVLTGQNFDTALNPLPGGYVTDVEDHTKSGLYKYHYNDIYDHITHNPYLAYQDITISYKDQYDKYYNMFYNNVPPDANHVNNSMQFAYDNGRDAASKDYANDSANAEYAASAQKALAQAKPGAVEQIGLDKATTDLPTFTASISPMLSTILRQGNSADGGNDSYVYKNALNIVSTGLGRAADTGQGSTSFKAVAKNIVAPQLQTAISADLPRLTKIFNQQKLVEDAIAVHERVGELKHHQNNGTIATLNYHKSKINEPVFNRTFVLDYDMNVTYGMPDHSGAFKHEVNTEFNNLTGNNIPGTSNYQNEIDDAFSAFRDMYATRIKARSELWKPNLATINIGEARPARSIDWQMEEGDRPEIDAPTHKVNMQIKQGNTVKKLWPNIELFL
ncbi:MAG: hypothetical protein K0S11_86 [Gammaproteobacteria bacterium]|jgi:hypothetical protein|nr:hypothetical protein [Gammaproteobacteria bacterium]